MPTDQNLFSENEYSEWQPLADRMRPQKLEEIAGQQHLIAADKSLRQAIENGKLHSLILWGPPGTGKTTLARMIAYYCDAEFISLSAVLSGVKDIREAVKQAQLFQQQGKPSILFVDEVHRFNKSQQDAFLPYVEDGTFTFIGATTENPSFELNNALLSRARVYVLKSLTVDDIIKVLQRALADEKNGLGKLKIKVDNDTLNLLAEVADGDARRALNMLEIASDLIEDKIINKETIKHISGEQLRRFDNHGEAFYDQISALHKSVRGSAPDAALYWLLRMLDGGCDPFYVARRIVRMASEDIGNADPRALTIAMQAWDVQQRLGSPEGELALAQAVLYLASAAKSNAVYKAYNQAKADIKQYGSAEVPLHLRNAPTKLMKELDYGNEYRYAHDEPEGFAAGESYLPQDMPEPHYYQPVNRGLEIKIKEKLTHLAELDKQSTHKRSYKK